MKKNLIAKASTNINAPRSDIWDALVTPESIKRYMFGTDVTSKFYEGSPIVWRGEWQGKVYEDKGKVLKVDPGRVLQFSHYSPLSGLPDRPDSYHVVTIELIDKGGDVDYGARPLRRAIGQYIEDPLSEELLRGAFEGQNLITVSTKEVGDQKQLDFTGSTVDGEPALAAATAGSEEHH